MAYFGPFLVPADDLGFWRGSVTFSLIGVVLAIAALLFLRNRRQRAIQAAAGYSDNSQATNP